MDTVMVPPNDDFEESVREEGHEAEEEVMKARKLYFKTFWNENSTLISFAVDELDAALDERFDDEDFEDEREDEDEDDDDEEVSEEEVKKMRKKLIWYDTWFFLIYFLHL